MNPGPAISARSRWAGRSASSATTILAATSRGAMPTGFASCSATLVVKSPWPESFGGVSATPSAGSGKPAAPRATSECPEELIADHERSRQRVERTPHRIAAS